MTVSVDTALASVLFVSSYAARYAPIATVRDSGSKRRDVYDWQRLPAELPDVKIDLTSTGPQKHLLEGGALELYALVRIPEGSVATVTVVLRNTQPKPDPTSDKDVACWFQAGLSVFTEKPALVDRSKLRTTLPSDPDLASSELLYRNHMVFGAGHGCAVDVKASDVDGRLCQRVTTTFVPRQDVHRSMAGVSSANLSLSFMGSATREDVVAQLNLLANDYASWIAASTDSVTADGQNQVPPHLRSVATDHMGQAANAHDRIRAGIQLLVDDEKAFEAFQLANQAMHLQRSRQDWVRNGAKGEFVPGNQAWRPFQIAFILINLPSVTDDQHRERDIADLLWFPTGGGKTEAYLGLVAYLLLLRRLRNTNVRGVAVIMRYTLRLLTIQQFERAAMLICSLESVRLQNVDRIGGTPFGIGLWVGGGATPNDIATARTNLGKLRNHQEVVEGNPKQIEACPWCGTRLTVDNYRIVKVPSDQMLVSCANKACEFVDGLPVHIVDTDVYRERPELVIGTVDKFAGMSWRGDIATLFGRISPADLGPDLIIQDELHLISGPLGSTVGLFETAVDLAASGIGREKGSALRKPKIIASTATIRRANDQIRSVFNRESRLFPPPGLDPDDSFFASKAPSDQFGTRQYVGVLASGTSHATLMVRTYASLLHSSNVIEGAATEDRDPYWTLVGYFNSLRVLGSAYLQVYDDVRARLNLLAKRDGRLEGRGIQLSELTSRVENHKIPEALKSLEKGLMGSQKPEDVVLATNMISVGLDVDRLGLMAVMGQPQSSAEYIQATSRVGRQHPGLVVTIFNAARTRDRSHYESFNDFHGALYRAVEATSATPFAARSRDRGLHATLVSALRMLVPELRGTAGHVRDESAAVDEVMSWIGDRVAAVEPDEASATREELERLLNIWRQAALADAELPYEGKKNSPHALLIDSSKALEDPDFVYSTSSIPWPTPRSMRDVDAETALRPAPMRKDASLG
ncbi:helicase-related protein [Paenarthrobacter nicotinovorans]|uniref:helicase-related protein n=1 Tax=Paenarthrobacter nicotinovorans TaxID=29320 RepID=UPI001EE1807F|nr:helicase-related protein [Paenarthrobacter nicotinovorans]